MSLQNASAKRCTSLFMLLVFIVFCCDLPGTFTHEAKDFDDSILYKIEFDVPDLKNQPENAISTFYTHENEKYDCVIPSVRNKETKKEANEPELSPFQLLQPIFNVPGSCSYRIEAYWSYEVCHGHHVRQYHEEREGKNIKFQEYVLGKLTEEKVESLMQEWEASRKSGAKLKTTKIDNTKYPYLEFEMTGGTMCDIIEGPRTTTVRYVCYPHGKNEIYSFKETSSCNYEAIILTSVLCVIPAFHPEESMEVAIKCFNSATDIHKPLSMLRQELNELMMSDEDFPVLKDSNSIAATLTQTTASGDRYLLLNKFGSQFGKAVLEWMSMSGSDIETEQGDLYVEYLKNGNLKKNDMQQLREFISGSNCLTGVSIHNMKNKLVNIICHG